MTSGAIDPVIILPASAGTWTAERRRLVLLHELAHVKRNDWLSLVLCEIAVAFWWFHPLAWIALRAARREAEKATDDAVVRAGARPSVYASHLIDIVRSVRGAGEPVGAMAMARPSDLEARLRALLDRRGRGPSSLIGRGLAVGLAGFAVMLATVEPTYAAGNEETVESAPLVLAKNDRKHRASHEDHYGEGMDAHRRGRYRESIEHFQKAIDEGQREAAATYNVACGYARLGDSTHAFEWLEKAVDAGFDVRGALDTDDDLNSLREDPRFRQLKAKARVARQGGRDSEAKRVATRFDRLAARNPASADPWYSMGRELLHAGDYDRAAKAFQEAAARTDKPGNALYNTACALSLKGDARNALDHLERAIEAGYDDPRHMDRDDDLDGIRDEPRFRELRKMAQDLSAPKVGYGSKQRWFSKFTRGDYEQQWRDTAKRLDAFARAHPRSGHAYYKLGYAHLALDEPEDAAAAFERALQLGYRKSATLYNLACAEARSDNKDRAFQYLDRAIEAGFNAAGQIRNDDDLDNLRGDPRYRAAIRKADVAARSKEHDDDE
jgi:tetratricopeptide (TPR) repeat protein